jgi:hypothetical protein
VKCVQLAARKLPLRRTQAKLALKYPNGLITMPALMCKLGRGEEFCANQEEGKFSRIQGTEETGIAAITDYDDRAGAVGFDN